MSKTSKQVTPVALAVPVRATMAQVSFLNALAWWVIAIARLGAWACTELSPYQAQKGFRVNDYDGRLLLQSAEVDRFIQSGGLEIPWEYSSFQYRLPSALERFKYLNLRRHYAKGRAMFNGKLLGLACNPDPHSKLVQLHPIGYFDHIASSLVVDDYYFTPGYEKQLYQGIDLIVVPKSQTFVDLIELHAANIISGMKGAM